MIKITNDNFQIFSKNGVKVFDLKESQKEEEKHEQLAEWLKELKHIKENKE